MTTAPGARLPTPRPAPTRGDRLLPGLRAALAAHPRWARAVLQPLPDRGLAHAHVRLAGSGLLARIPKQSQVGLDAQSNLVHQAACFERAAPSGHTPRLAAVLAPTPQLPRGALLVEEIAGGSVALPAGLPAIAAALAAIHALPLPARSARSPLPAPADPLALLLAEVDAQARHAPAARLDAAVQRLLQDEREQLRRDASRLREQPVRLIAFDAHPGNFLVRPDGSAVLVDLEKCRYSLPGLDLAHATLYTSTTWDASTSTVLQLQDVAGFYRSWEQAVGPAIAGAARPWHVALRRAMWLWSLSWCCQWRVLSDRPPQSTAHGQDWSAAHSDAALVGHVRGRVDDYLSPAGVERVREELQALQRLLAA